ncbi:FAD/NAD(P)-binding domain-containing protein [Polyplosphaeria fusca]|uniref:FAD/NAD(P)-binding domain-containing protein n=1 Tax=Polyplosphaeria fusca TaxID=682080 RepID=A0A9P4UXG0_9PLEO|nr:FAD/NAD(P)-binding domain-containing protein [Polyplosphaeria fusca]
MAAETSKDVIIIGGSISGLMHGVVLKAHGHSVRILEAREPNALKAEAGGLSLGPQVLELMETYLPEDGPYGLPNTHTQFLDSEGVAFRETPIAFKVKTSSWNIVYDQLKRAFERNTLSGTGGTYETGKIVLDLMQDGNGVKVLYRDNGGKGYEARADLVIAADGGRSVARSKLIPDSAPEYAGYVAWRGCVPETLVPDELKGVSDGKLLMHFGQNNYILAYSIPSSSERMEPEDTLLDWVWYDIYDQNSSDFEEIMTGSDGRRRNVTVPKGYLSKAVWDKKLLSAKNTLPSHWFEVISASQKPYVTAITNFKGTRAVFYDGKLLLAGDAFAQCKPHLGMSSNQAALQALNLVKVLREEITFDEWEKAVKDWSDEFAYRSAAMGQFGLTGKYPEGYVPLHAVKK